MPEEEPDEDRHPEPLIDAGRLAGLLADPDRLRVVSALALGHGTIEEIVRLTGLQVREVAVALNRLIQGDLVETDGGHHVLLEVAFRQAARAAAPTREPEDVEGLSPDLSADSAKVLRTFVRDGRITQIPMQRSKRIVLLDMLAQEFELGERYSERQVNLILGRWHADFAAWRRYLVDESFMTRADGQYWRSGGSVDVR